VTTPLNATTFPLWGSRLIEASAGTGKTWTIAALYLRLILGHGGENACVRPLLPTEILVMTFTRAATKELSDRIRARLLEAARCFRGEADAPPHDNLLQELLAAYPDEAARNHAAWQLATAAENMDEASVHTIDAWCQRMLREHAFDSGNPFDEELLADESALLAEAVRDYWRQHCYPLSSAQLHHVLNVWKNVDKLRKDAGGLVNLSLPTLSMDASLGACIDRVQGVRETRLRELSSGWVDRVQEMKVWLDEQKETNRAAWNGHKLRSDHYSGWLDVLRRWANDPLNEKLDLSAAATQRLRPAGMLDARKAGAPSIELPDHFARFSDLWDGYAALPDLKEAMRLHAASNVARILLTLKRRARGFGFADMLTRLDQALSGPHGARLRERICTRYPVALVDEFQDTSPLQYRLFDQLYRTADNDRNTGLFLIGDPKQSIYGFRGADIHSYLKARRATAGRHYVLDTNYRSTTALVAAVNHWFEQAETRDGPGAFLFRNQDENALPFEAVRAKGRAEAFQTSGGTVAALSIHHDLTLRSTADHMRLFAARCAEQIVTWLNDTQAGFACEGKPFERLKPADIAILVKSGKEADAVRHELQRRGVASVYLSDKDSVFASEQARDLLYWLRAVSAPTDARKLRAALATSTVGLSLDELTALASSDEALDTRIDQMQMLYGVWQRYGVLAMLRQTLHLLGLPARWLASPEGERRLTNYLHLAELLQNASVRLESEQALVLWLAARITDDAKAGDEQVVRLESDDDLVKVVTIHGSKGLEYPVVFLPFSCSFWAVTGRNTHFLTLADACGNRSVKLRYSKQDLQQADQERLQEDLRLFYVAATRARHALWMGFAALKSRDSDKCKTHRSAPGYLAGGVDEKQATRWQPLLEALTERSKSAGNASCIELHTAAETVACTALAARQSRPRLEDTPGYDASFERHWSLGSFSSLVRSIDASGAHALQVRNRAEDEPADDVEPLLPEPAMASIPLPSWHRFPKGASSGDFLHEQLEWLAAEGFALSDDRVEAGLRRRCERSKRAGHTDDIVHWLKAVLAHPLPSLGTTLKDLRCHLTEMEFWLPSSRLDARAIDALCHAHLLDGQVRPVLPQRQLNGMLMGFADLVFEHEGRYWVLDYKSNSLGGTGAAYGRDALQAAMAAHRYDVQAALYLLALHRLLKVRLGAAYDPAAHLGGALYVFIRGIDGPAHGEYSIAATPDVVGMLDDLDALFMKEESVA
jgi:exodeoxyribonuclease V beta subunit